MIEGIRLGWAAEEVWNCQNSSHVDEVKFTKMRSQFGRFADMSLIKYSTLANCADIAAASAEICTYVVGFEPQLLRGA
jgi:hypothetical protein